MPPTDENQPPQYADILRTAQTAETLVEYIIKNGMMTDISVLQGTPFTDKGTVADLFSGDQDLWHGIRQTIEKINANALTV